MNSKYIRMGCLLLSVILFLFTGWLRVKGDYKVMFQSGIQEVISQYSSALEEFSMYSEYSDMLGLGIDMDDLKDVEKFLNRVEDGVLTPMEAALTAPKMNSIISAMSSMMYMDGEDLDSVQAALTVYAVIFWVTFVAAIAALITAFIGKGKAFNVLYVIGMIVILGMFMLIAIAANDEADAKIIGTGFWSVLAIIIGIVALFFRSRRPAPNPMGAVPPYAMNGGYAMGGYQQNPYQRATMQPQGWTCPTCGAPQKMESRFCATCGTPQPQPQAPVQPQGWTCPVCGAPQKMESRFCATCGAPQPQPQTPVSTFCKYCGAKLQSDDQFCPECGAQTNA